MQRHPSIAEMLVRERQRELLSEAEAERLAGRYWPRWPTLWKQRSVLWPQLAQLSRRLLPR